MPGTIENLRELAREYSSSIQEGEDVIHVKKMRADMLGIALDRQILDKAISTLEEKGYTMSGVMDTFNRDVKEKDGIAIMFKRREVIHSDFWYGQLIWVGLQKSGESIGLSVHHGQWPGLIHFDPNSGLTEEQNSRFKRHLDKAMETPGRFEWYEGMADERYTYV